ncbi:MAG: DUF2927 domain-containing protein [Xanthobacteraceae bacterium]|nr:DUF2927 domain-containing protein [Xanthobacteraceae bacterium]
MVVWRSLVTAGLATIALGIGLSSTTAEVPAIAERQKNERKDFTDAEISDGFIKTAFGAEYDLAGHVDRIRKYQKPVRIFVKGVTSPDRRKQLADVVSDIDRRIPNIDIAMANKLEAANVVVTFVNDRDLDSSLRKFYGAEHARAIRKALNPQCLSGFRKNGKYEIEHSEVILTVDNGDFIFLDCAYEELLQSLGPINDTRSIPWTMFNDDVSMGFFDVYDQYLLNILYDPHIKAGMSADEVRPILPKILPDIRSTVAKLNNLPNIESVPSK